MFVCLSICSQFLSETVDQRLFAIFENFYHQISLEIILNVNGVAIVISLGTPYQAKISFVIYGSKCSRSMKQQDCKICYEQLWNKIDFLHADKRQSLLQIILPSLIDVVRLAQIANQNAKLPEGQYLRKHLVNYSNFIYKKLFFIHQSW